MKNILLTGGSGMIGKNFLEHESCKSHNVIAPTSKELDLLDKKSISSFISKTNPDVIVHAAGRVGGIQANIAHPIEFLKENLEMGINIISCAYDSGVLDFINLASSCMYPKHAKNPLTESLILDGSLEPTNEGYALAKIATTKMCQYISESKINCNYKTLIPCNQYGRHDKFSEESSHLLPAVIKKIHSAKINDLESVLIWGDGTARREFMYARDLADFLFFAIKNIDKLPQNINVGLGYDYSIKEYYEAVATVIGYKGEFLFDLTKPVGMKQKLVDITLLENLGWSENTSLIDGINEAYKFYLEEFDK